MIFSFPSYIYKVCAVGFDCLFIYILWPFPPVWGVADNTNNGGFYSVLLAMTRDPVEFGKKKRTIFWY